jgi:tetratricopeptide (TPR) repeat protein
MKTHRLPCLALIAPLLLAASSWTLAEPDVRTRALAAYDEARYDEALELLARLDADGQARGADLYRLYYCQTVANMPAARETQRRAIAALEQDLQGATDAEVSFYLANAYRNVGRLSDMQRVAGEATSKVESKEWPAPTSGTWAFRLGKLYADQGGEAKAAEWYDRAVTMLVDEGKGDSTYARWASRYLGRRAYDAGDHEGAARHYKILLDGDDGTVEDLDRLAVSSLRLNRFVDAAAAWRRAVILEPATSNRSRYAAQLCDAAREFDGLPESAPDGKPWESLGRGELEQLLADQAGKGRSTVASAKGTVLEADGYAKLSAEINEIRGLFVRAALEYILQGYPIRETAFRSGYAPMIFRESEWTVPKILRPAGMRKGKAKGKAKSKAAEQAESPD